MLQIKFIRSVLLVCAYVCLSVFLVEKTVVPLLHQHHEVHASVKGDSLQQTTDCFACDLAKATLDTELVLALCIAFVLVCSGVLQLFYPIQQNSIAVIFSSLRAPPARLTA
ncbi:MAG: hypothetical protein H7282_12540 [Cytophagaceae bacterium]|nr:hypothetical protein [Cytophagaceae bacterium]